MEIQEIEVPGVQRGHFLLGLAGSIFGALIGAVAWWGIAAATEYELGIIAWALGGLAGYSMVLGYRRPSVAAGIVAALVAVFGILGARTMIVTYFSRAELASLRTGLAVLDLPVKQVARVAGLANTDADRKTVREHRCPFDEFYWEQFVDAAGRYAAMPADELAVAFSARQEWRRTGRFEDPEYIRDTLPYCLLEDKLIEVWVRREPMPPETWEPAIRDVQTKAAALSPDEQSRICRRRLHATGAAWLKSARRCMEQNVAPGDKDGAVSLAEAAWAEALDLDDAALADAFLVAESWEEEGQWNDPAWLRLRLAYENARRAWCEHEGLPLAEDPLPGPTWTACVREATARAADVPEADLAQAVRQTQEAAWEVDQQQRKQAVQFALAATIVMGVFSTFGAIDLLFLGLAAYTAYRIARRGGLSPAQNTPGRPSP